MIRKTLTSVSVILTFILMLYTNCLFNASAFEGKYILIEAQTRTIIEENNSNVQVNCGYLSKLVSLLLIAEDIETGKYALTDTLTASSSVTNTKGAIVWLESGDKMTVDELIKSVVVGNANDALTVLAEKSQQTIEKFTEEMNKRCFELGLRNSVFLSPYGYYSENEYTTAFDLAIVCAELSEYDFMEPYFKIWRDFVKDGKTELVNENILSRDYKKHIGFKAANSEQSGYCIAEAGKSEDGVIYIAVILGAENENDVFSCAKKLIEKGINEYMITVPGFLDELLLPMKVKNGSESAVELMLRLNNNVVIPISSKEISNIIVLPDYVSAPIKKGQKIGSVAFFNDESLLYETEIIAKSDVNKLSYRFVLKKMLLKLCEK